ncbi:MAG: DegT/DnrJ/EryC1/StrS family aminotransferase [Halobacteriovoraceae bacterium]|nr:DegT/DnrJ/EryC1/StrS family aminotransferase [Halobacteriovoraceae bacterium]
MTKLAIHGGSKVRNKLFPGYFVLGEEEAQAAYNVVKSGILSKYLGCWHEDFFGGPQVQAFEKEWGELFESIHCVSVNSNTSGIICALGAIGLGPGDEVIVTGYSMSISASAPLFYGATPVFADVEDDCFCISPKSIESKITPNTKAIIAVDIFGQPSDFDELNRIKKQYNLMIIEDTAQAPYAKFRNKFAGNLGDIGIFSLNYHKHIHTGEGGMIVTDNDDLAMRCRLIRNHAEAVVDGMKYDGDLTNMIGMNLRMPEIEAAIGRSLLKKLPSLINMRLENVQYMEEKLKKIDFLTMPKVREHATHVYYAHPMKFDSAKANNKTRSQFVQAVRAELMPCEKRETEGVLIGEGYVKPLYLQSVYQKKIAFGKANYPFESPLNKNPMNYERGICPITEDLHFNKLISHELMRPGMSKEDLDDVCNAFIKVAENLEQL